MAAPRERKCPRRPTARRRDPQTHQRAGAPHYVRKRTAAGAIQNCAHLGWGCETRLTISAYGISSILELLVATAQLTATENVGKRYADTTVLAAGIYGNGPTDFRTLEAFRRLNYLHGLYIKQGRITNDDLLYTLSLFLLSVQSLSHVSLNTREDA
jgi:hypothetical protein